MKNIVLPLSEKFTFGNINKYYHKFAQYFSSEKLSMKTKMEEAPLQFYFK